MIDMINMINKMEKNGNNIKNATGGGDTPTVFDIVVASRNKKKIRELRELFAEVLPDRVRLLSLDEIGYTDEIEEDGASFEENSALKSSVPASLGYIGFADDSGLSVDALGGAPGVFSARYSGEGATDEENNKKLLSELENVDERSAGYVCAVTLAAPEKFFPLFFDKKGDKGEYFDYELSEYISKKRGMKIGIISVRGECRGEILRRAVGDGGFGYDPYFYFPSLKKTFAELSPEEKHAVSHRGEAMRRFGETVKKIFG